MQVSIHEHPSLDTRSRSIMSDYEKLTVIKLREELVKRELPKTGLKAALVQRLVEADAKSAAIAVNPEPAVEQQTKEVPRNDPPVADPPAQVQAKDETKAVENALKGNDVQQHATIEAEVVEVVAQEGKDSDPDQVIEGAQPETIANVEAETPARPGTPDQPANVAASIAKAPDKENPQDELLPGNLTQAANSKDPSSEPQLLTPAQTQLEPNQVQDGLSRISTQTSLTGEEIIEDSRKRKRRSHSPPPSSIETQKRLKSGDAGPHVELPEDFEAQDATMDDAPPSGPSLDGPSSQAAETQINGHDKAAKLNKGMDTPPSTRPIIDEDVTPVQNGATKIEAIETWTETAEASKPDNPIESPAKTSPSDTRFKNLFPGPSKPDTSVQQPIYSDGEDRLVTPALHPATSALYIRELMRPLKPETVKDHLIALATPPDAATDSGIVTEFHLDSIRTHCLVTFANISAASRVRSSLHDRIWPNERDRRPLFVDFVPEEKLKKWIDVEHSTPSGRGQPTKKWEVVYEDDGGEMKAYLQETGSNQSGRERADAKLAPSATAGQGVQGAPSGPRVRESEPRASRLETETGKGFQALDDLFKSTVAKPKLYFQPVAKVEADRRLTLLKAARGGGRSDEMRRFTFEDDIIVDKSPEFGHRARGGYGGYGGRSGGFAGGNRGRGRGGGYRGDGYRGGERR